MLGFYFNPVGLPSLSSLPLCRFPAVLEFKLSASVMPSRRWTISQACSRGGFDFPSCGSNSGRNAFQVEQVGKDKQESGRTRCCQRCRGFRWEITRCTSDSSTSLILNEGAMVRFARFSAGNAVIFEMFALRGSKSLVDALGANDKNYHHHHHYHWWSLRCRWALHQ